MPTPKYYLYNHNLNPMQISVEVTFTPLQDAYEPEIIAFIKKLRASGFTVLENPLSTQVYGAYDALMGMLQKEIKVALQGVESGLMYIKIVKSDRSDYEPNF